MRTKKTISILAILCLFCLTLAAPAMAERYYKPAKAASNVKKGEVLIVGKIRVDPPLEPGEQNLRSRPLSSKNRSTMIVPGLRKFTNSFFMLLGTKNESPTRKNLIKNEVLVPIDETFFLAGKKRPIYVHSTGIVMTLAQSMDGKSRAFLPAGYKVNIRKGDKAVYIGTIVYTRDEFMRVKGVKVINEYKAAKKDLKQKFGNIKLRKALVKVK